MTKDQHQRFCLITGTSGEQNFEKLSDDDKEEFIEYFEPVQENLCDILFCEDNVAKDLYNFMQHRNDEDAKKIEAALWHKFLFMEEGVQY